jgi:hypothetical protein
MTFKVGDRVILKEEGKKRVWHWPPKDNLFTITGIEDGIFVVTHDGAMGNYVFNRGEEFFQLAEPEKLLSYEDLL